MISLLFYIIMKCIPTGHAMNIKELFENFNYDGLSITDEQLLKSSHAKKKTRKKLVEEIFSKSFDMILEDIIEDNIQFQFPTIGSANSWLQIERVTGDDFKRAYKKGKWREVDFLKSNFTGYKVMYTMQSTKRSKRLKNIYTSARLRQKLTDYTNQGRQY